MSEIQVNTINEYTGANGVTIDGVLIKDGGIASSYITGGTGKVLQVVNSSISTRETTTATTQQDSALTASITPSSTSNKVLCLVSYQVGASADIWIFVNLDRDGTTIGGSIRHNPFASSINRLEAGSINYLDSPSSTSALTYTVQYGSNQAGTKIFNGRNSGSSDSYATLTLMEIAG